MEKTYILMRELPPEERPRERLARLGTSSLRNEELLAILLRVGTKRKSALELARELIVHFGGLRGIASATVHQLAQMSGIGLAKAAQISAAVEFGRRVALAGMGDLPQIRSPEDVYSLLIGRLQGEKREHLLALILDVKNRVLKTETISIGTLDSSLVHPREVYRVAIREGAANIIIAHNHPSGDPTPSPEDIQITRRLWEAGTLIGIDLLDHVIVGDGKYVSLRERGVIAG